MKKKKLLSLLLSAACVFAFAACSSTNNNGSYTNAPTDKQDSKGGKTVEINVSAAASLKDALEKINENYKQATGTTVVLNLGGSGALSKQIKEGAPTDLFISASNKAMNELVENGTVEKESVSVLLKNSLVLVVPKDNAAKIEKVEDLANLDEKSKLAIGETETVPAGQYAKESLTNLKLWDKVESHVVYAKDVRQVRSYVEGGEAVAGFIYSSDATGDDKIKVVQTMDESTHKKIVYPSAVIKGAANAEAAKEYEAFLKTDASMKIFEEFGFKMAE